MSDVAQQGQYPDLGIDLLNPFGRHERFRAARLGVCPVEQDGTGQVGRLDDIKVDNYQVADSKQGQVLERLIS